MASKPALALASVSNITAPTPVFPSNERENRTLRNPGWPLSLGTSTSRRSFSPSAGSRPSSLTLVTATKGISAPLSSSGTPVVPLDHSMQHRQPRLQAARRRWVVLTRLSTDRPRFGQNGPSTSRSRARSGGYGGRVAAREDNRGAARRACSDRHWRRVRYRAVDLCATGRGGRGGGCPRPRRRARRGGGQRYR